MHVWDLARFDDETPILKIGLQLVYVLRLSSYEFVTQMWSNNPM